MRRSNALLRLCFVTALSILPGCAVSNHYERPIVDVPPEWRWKNLPPEAVMPASLGKPVPALVATDSTPAKTAPLSTAPVVADPANAPLPVATILPGAGWWTVFSDPKLDELQALACSGNQDIKAAVGRIDEARASLRVNRANFYPQISANPGYQRSELSGSTFIPGSGGRAAPGIRKPYNDYNLPVALSYELDVFGRVRNLTAAARERAEAAVADFDAVLLAVQADIATDYFMLRALDTQLDVLQRSKKLQQEAYDLVNSRFQLGAVDATDPARSRVELATTDASIASVKRQREQTVNALAILCGRPAPSFAVDFQLLNSVPPVIPAGLPSELLERRPDVVRGERSLIAACHDIAVARTAFYPRFSITASGGFESTQLSSLLNGPSTFWNVGGNLLQPLFTGGRNKAELEAARARFGEAEAAYRQEVLIAFREVEDALVEIRYRGEEGAALGEAVRASAEATGLALERYRRGVTSNFEFVDAQRRQLQVEQQAADNLGQRMIAAVRLVRALGGGWGP